MAFKEIYLPTRTPGQSQVFNIVEKNVDPNVYDGLLFRPAKNLVVPNYYKVNWILLRLVTSAAVANRVAYIQARLAVDGADSGHVVLSYKSENIVASKSGVLLAGPVGNLEGATVYTTSVWDTVELRDLIISEEAYISLTTSAHQAGDLFNAFIQAEYLNNKEGITEA